MQTTRVFITMSNETRGANISAEHFLRRFLPHYEPGFFGGGRFDAAVWCRWNMPTWHYSTYNRNDAGRLTAMPGGAGTLNFIRQVADGADGSVAFDRFVSTFLGGPMFRAGAPILANMQSPLFSIIDHNSAHHLSFVLANKAFRAYRGHARKIVVNLDAHEDYGHAVNWQQIGCQNWGRKLLAVAGRPRWLPGGGVERYVAFCLNHHANRARLWRSNGQTLIGNAAAIQPGNVGHGGLPNAVLGQFLGPNLNNAAVYITIDRDFMAGSWTPYGDGSYAVGEGRQIIQGLINYLRGQGAQIVGADMIGLPCESQYLATTPQQQRQALVQMRDDINLFYGLINAY